MSARNILQAAAGSQNKSYVDDVFSTYLYQGTGAVQTINNGIDLAGKGGLTWIKVRSTTFGHFLFDTARGVQTSLSTNTTGAQSSPAGDGVTSFNSNGFTLTSGAGAWNSSSNIYTSWTFRNAPKFFTHTTVSHTGGTQTNVDLSSLGTVGMVMIKSTTFAQSWIVHHRSLSAGQVLVLNTTGAAFTDTFSTLSGTTLTINSSGTTGTYVIYAWAHDASTDGMVQCGSASGTAQVTLGWEPQFVLAKQTDSTSNWILEDTMRGLDSNTTSNPALLANTSGAETVSAGSSIAVNSTGFTGVTAGWTSYIYLAIRIPNKPPTSGTEVFRPVVYTGTNADNRLVNTGIKTDLAWFRQRNGSSAGFEGFVVGDRLRGQPWLRTGSTVAEATGASDLDQQLVSTTQYGTAFSSMTGVWVGSNDGTAASNINANTTTNNHVALAFKRAPGFMDIVCYTGDGTTGKAVNHSLGISPDFIIVKRRDGGGIQWFVQTSRNWNLGFGLHLTDPESADNVFIVNTPTATQFTVKNPFNDSSGANASGGKYVAYLFATLPGISKVGSYTGNGTSQTIDCGFTTGARFVMIKRTDAASDWWVFDTARGIVAGNDPILFANATNAESTTADPIDPSNVGFIVGATTGSMNNTGASYIYLAIA